MILRYNKITPNLNIDVPNLFNVHRSFNNVISNKWRWNGSPDKTNNYYFLTGEVEGFHICKVSENSSILKLISTISTTDDSPIDNFILFGDSE